MFKIKQVFIMSSTSTTMVADWIFLKNKAKLPELEMHHSELNTCNATHLCLNFKGRNLLSIYIIVFIHNVLYGITCRSFKEFCPI